MLFSTKGLVTRSVRYGESSLVVTVFTELFGLRSYMVNGVRTSKLKSAFKPAMFQPGALLELVVYEQEGKNLQRIRECKWSVLYTEIFTSLAKNAVSLFIIELLQKCLRQPEPQPELFYFTEDALITLDKSSATATANFHLFFILHLSHFLGFRMEDGYSEKKNILDLREGNFVFSAPDHQYWLAAPFSEFISYFLKAQHPSDTESIYLNREQRRKLLEACLLYYSLHYPDFGVLKSVPVLQAIME
jgi:DNA repair protein RecO (recombination protein O)